MKDEIATTIEKVVNGLYGRFHIPGYGRDDIKQEIRLYCLEALDDYDSERGSLKTFLWTHARNRLLNLFNKEVLHPDRSLLVNPVSLEDVKDHLSYEDGPDQQNEYNEMIDKINSSLPMHIRGDFIKMLDGLKIDHNRKERVRRYLADLLEEDDE